MARIRTIKPEFYRHVRLYEAEKETGFPLRVAFSGLFTASDREGRFEWVPQALKLDCLPYDDVDFSRVLDALATRGFIVRYSFEGRDYGVIPSFTKHQVINNKERASILPDPAKCEVITTTLTGQARVADASSTRLSPVQGEGKGTEGNKEGKFPGIDASLDRDFDAFWAAYPKRGGDNPRKPARQKFEAALRRGAKVEDIIAGAKAYAANPSTKVGTEFVKTAEVWLNKECWKDQATGSAPAAKVDYLYSDEYWNSTLDRFEGGGSWSIHGGPTPRRNAEGFYVPSPGCTVPQRLLDERNSRRAIGHAHS